MLRARLSITSPWLDMRVHTAFGGFVPRALQQRHVEWKAVPEASGGGTGRACEVGAVEAGRHSRSSRRASAIAVTRELRVAEGEVQVGVSSRCLTSTSPAHE